MEIGDRAYGIFFTGNGTKIMEGEIIAEFYGDYRLDTKELGILGLRPQFAFESREAAEVFLVMET